MFKKVLLISIIIMISLSSIVLAADELPDVEGNMTEDEIEEAVMLTYAAYLQDNSTKKEVKFLIKELQKMSDTELATYFSKTKYKNDITIPNIALNKVDKSFSDEFRIYLLAIKNNTDQKLKLNPGITKITGITSSSRQVEAYNYYNSEIPDKLTKNMIKDSTIYPRAQTGYTILFPYTDEVIETIYIDSIIYEDGHREEIKIENLY